MAARTERSTTTSRVKRLRTTLKYEAKMRRAGEAGEARAVDGCSNSRRSCVYLAVEESVLFLSGFEEREGMQ
jgi:hypothetical protein